MIVHTGKRGRLIANGIDIELSDWQVTVNQSYATDCSNMILDQSEDGQNAMGIHPTVISTSLVGKMLANTGKPTVSQPDQLREAIRQGDASAYLALIDYLKEQRAGDLENRELLCLFHFGHAQRDQPYREKKHRIVQSLIYVVGDKASLDLAEQILSLMGITEGG
jgi:hypothetical protein